jgi:hypothetical protein
MAALGSELKVDGPSAVSSTSSTSSPSDASVLSSILEMLTRQGEENAKMREDVAALRMENSQLRAEVESDLRRITRRQSMVLPVAGPATPLPSPPKVSSMTHSAFSQIRTPASAAAAVVRPGVSGIRRSVGPTVHHEFESDGDVDEDHEDEKTEEESKVESKKAKVNEDKEADRLAKIMAKRKAPEPITGEKESERENIEYWVNEANEYLDSQFGTLAHKYPKERLQLIKGYIQGSAGVWLQSVIDMNPYITWEEVQLPFIHFISGGRESRSLWLERMKGLVYGKGKCKDLLSMEKEFDQLRIKLYPTSSTDPSMNEVVGREYAEVIRRGDINLYKEMLRILGGKETITLSEWKTAAVNAAKICALTAASQRQGGSGGSQPNRWGHNNKYAPLAGVNEMSAEGDSEDQTEDKGEGQPGASAQQMQGKRTGSSINRFKRPSGPFIKIEDEEKRVIMEKGLCWQCYKAGHHIGDPACKEKGKPRRRPTKEELNA